MLDAEKQMKHLEQQTAFDDVTSITWSSNAVPCGMFSRRKFSADNVDLLILGTRGRGGLKKLALGSVAEEVLHLASCPVLTVGPNVPPAGPDVSDFKRILFATDFGSASNQSLLHTLCLWQ
jgi:hypothetical protein